MSGDGVTLRILFVVGEGVVLLALDFMVVLLVGAQILFTEFTCFKISLEVGGNMHGSATVYLETWRDCLRC